MKTLRVAMFMRGSTNKQTNKGKLKRNEKMGKQSARQITLEDDLPLQKEKILEFIDSQPESKKNIKWDITGLEYVEAGVSGFHTHVSKRIGLNKAFEDAKAGLFDILVIYKLDRFGRRSVESLNHALKFLRFCRIWVVDKNREFTNNQDYDEILNFIEFWSAKKSSVDTKIRVTDAMNIIHKEGYWTGGNAPYGYINHPTISNMLEICPQEAEIVKEIYRLYTSEGYGMLKISGLLNEKNFKTKTGLYWKSENIRKILRNTIYKGYLSYGKTKTIEGEFGGYQKYVKQGNELISTKYWKEYDIVGEDIWELAQKIKQSRIMTDNIFGSKNPTKLGTGKGLLIGILKCQCGSNMTYSSTSDWIDRKNKKKGEPYGIYRCLKRIKSGVESCKAIKGSYKCVELEREIIDKINLYTKNLITSNLLSEIQKRTLDDSKNIIEKLDMLKRDIEKWNKVKENTNSELLKILMGEITNFSEKQLKELYEKSVIELEKLQKAHDELETIKRTSSASESDILYLNNVLQNWHNIFQIGTIEQKRRIVKSFVSEIRLNGNDIDVDIEFNIINFFEAVNIDNTNSIQQYNNHRSSDGSNNTSTYRGFIQRLNRTFPCEIKCIIK